MNRQVYPFADIHGTGARPGPHNATYLPIRISNPASGLGLVTLALIDTGADTCTFPASLARLLGHNYDAPEVQRGDVSGVSGNTQFRKHTFVMDILDATMTRTVHRFPARLLSCVDSDIPPLIGVLDCLADFRLTVDYPGRWFSLISSTDVRTAR